jgi:hypothetical protein
MEGQKPKKHLPPVALCADLHFKAGAATINTQERTILPVLAPSYCNTCCKQSWWSGP